MLSGVKQKISVVRKARRASQAADAQIVQVAQRASLPQNRPEFVHNAGRFLKAIKDCDDAAAMALLSPTVKISMQEQGSVRGADVVRPYLREVKERTRFDAPFYDDSTGLVTAKGSVKIHHFPVSVRAVVLFNAAGQIEEVYFGKA